MTVLLVLLSLSSVSASTFPWYNTSLTPTQRATALVAAMELSEKYPQLSVGAPGISRLNVTAYQWRSNALHGMVSNGVATVFPQAIGMGATFDADLLHAVARAISDEQRAKHNIATNFSSTNPSPMDYGLDVWGPNGNLYVHPQWGRGQETYGEDPTLSAILGAAFVRGLQEGPVAGMNQLLATPKHFDAYSVDKEPPRLSFMPTISETDLRQTYFPFFESVVNAGAASIMCSYNGVKTVLDAPGEDPISIEAPMCANPLLKRVLRDEWGFGLNPVDPSDDNYGYLVTDSGALEFMVSEFHRFNETYEAAAAAMQQGVDLNSGTIYAHDLPTAVSKGLVTESQLDTALRRLFVARIKVGLFDPPTAYDKLNQSDIMSDAHLTLARQVAEASVVLLKNEDNLLPLDVSKLSNVLVTGPAANDTYRLVGNYAPCTNGAWDPLLPGCHLNASTPLAAITSSFQASGVTVNYALGCDQESNRTSGFQAATELAKDADVVLFVGGLRNCEGGQGRGGPRCISEGHDRPDLMLPGEQSQLIQALTAAGTPIVVVLMDGGPVAINWEAQHVPAIVETFYGGHGAGDALVNVLTGAAAPGGRLPYTMFTGMDQVPTELAMNMTDAPGRTYRYLTQTPLFAFGYGLGYSPVNVTSPATVTPAKLPASSSMDTKVSVCGKVTNVGSTHSQDAVIQVYATLTSPTSLGGRSSVPLTTLVGFAKSGLLAPGATTGVCVDVDVRALRLVDPTGVYGLHAGYTYELSFGTTKPGPLGTFVPRSAVQEPLTTTLALV